MGVGVGAVLVGVAVIVGVSVDVCVGVSPVLVGVGLGAGAWANDSISSDPIARSHTMNSSTVHPLAPTEPESFVFPSKSPKGDGLSVCTGSPLKYQVIVFSAPARLAVIPTWHQPVVSASSPEVDGQAWCAALSITYPSHSPPPPMSARNLNTLLLKTMLSASVVRSGRLNQPLQLSAPTLSVPVGVS